MKFQKVDWDKVADEYLEMLRKRGIRVLVPTRGRGRPRTTTPARSTISTRAHRLRVISAGLCISCGNPRGKRGTRQHCRPCADTHNVYQRERLARINREAR